MSVWNIGKRVEALTLNSETYKDDIVRYLKARDFYLIADSKVEAIDPDCILRHKFESRETWLEVKATSVSINEKDFLKQLKKYILEYLKRSEKNKFRYMLATYELVNPKEFFEIFRDLNTEKIDLLLKKLLSLSDNKEKELLENKLNELVHFFEESILIIGRPEDIKLAEEKIIKHIPLKPELSEVEYAEKIKNNYGNVELTEGIHNLYSNLFYLEITNNLYRAKTFYRKVKIIFDTHPDTFYPAFNFEEESDGNFIYTFENLYKDNLFLNIIDINSIETIKIKDINYIHYEYIIIKTLNRVIKDICYKKGLFLDNRTKCFYYPKKIDNMNPIILKWRPKNNLVSREVTKPYIRKNGNLYYWAHRAANISVKKYLDEYYVQISPRWLFSNDGINILEGKKADRLDRKYRKSNYNRNPHKLNDVFFWFRTLFADIDARGIKLITNYFENNIYDYFKIKDVVKTTIDKKPDVEYIEEIDVEYESMDLESVSKIDAYLGGN